MTKRAYLLAALLAPTLAGAQALTPPTPGVCWTGSAVVIDTAALRTPCRLVIKERMRLRIQLASSPDRITGRVDSLTAMSLVLREPRPLVPVRIPLDSVVTVERSRGHARLAWSAGLGLAGLVGGILAGSVQASTSQRNDASLAPIGFGLGGLLGGLFMGAVAAPERWEKIPPDAVP